MANLQARIEKLENETGSGHILWLIGGLMTAGVLVGGWLGAHMAIKRGTHLIRWMLVIASLAMSVKLIHQYW